MSCPAPAASLSLPAAASARLFASDRRHGRRQSHVSDELVRPGRARRLLSGEGGGPVREGRPRRHDQDGRSAGQRACNCCSAGEADVMMGYDFQVLKSLAKGIPLITIAHVVPEGPAGPDDPRAGQGHATTSRTRPSWSRRRAARHGGRGCAPSTATPTRRPRPTPSTCSRSSTTRTSCSNPIRRRSRSRRCRRACRSNSSCSPTTATRPTAPPWSPRTKFVAERPDVARRFVKASIEGWKMLPQGRSRRPATR